MDEERDVDQEQEEQDFDLSSTTDDEDLLDDAEVLEDEIAEDPLDYSGDDDEEEDEDEFLYPDGEEPEAL